MGMAAPDSPARHEIVLVICFHSETRFVEGLGESGTMVAFGGLKIFGCSPSKKNT